MDASLDVVFDSIQQPKYYTKVPPVCTDGAFVIGAVDSVEVAGVVLLCMGRFLSVLRPCWP